MAKSRLLFLSLSAVFSSFFLFFPYAHAGAATLVSDFSESNGLQCDRVQNGACILTSVSSTQGVADTINIQLGGFGGYTTFTVGLWLENGSSTVIASSSVQAISAGCADYFYSLIPDTPIVAGATYKIAFYVGSAGTGDVSHNSCDGAQTFLTGGAASLTFVSPVPTSTPQADFLNWDIISEYVPTSTSASLRIDYDNGTNVFSDEAYIGSIGSSLNEFSFPKGNALLGSTSTAWTATARLIENGTTTVSSILNFNILPLGFGSSTAAESSSTCSNFGFIGDAFCNALVFVFVPPNSAFENFSNLKTMFQYKPPFGYFTGISAAFNSLAEGTSSIVLIDASTSAAFSDVFTPLKTGLGWLLYFIFAWWLFHRVRQMEL